MGRADGVLAWILGAWRWDWEACDGSRIRGWDLVGPGNVWPSDLMSQCPTGRDVYFRRRLGFDDTSLAMRRGSRLHDEALRVWRAALESGWEGLLAVSREVSSRGGLWALSSAYRWLRFRALLPLMVEPWLPGVAGVTGARPDLVFGVVPVELVSSRPGGWGWERKKRVLALYVLSLEAVYGVPVDHGFLVSLGEGVAEPVCVDDWLRLEAQREVQRLSLVLESDPGLPDSREACPDSCPFLRDCWGGGVAAHGGEAGVEAGPAAGGG